MIRAVRAAEHAWIASVAARVYGPLGDYGTIIRSWLHHPGVLTHVEHADGAAPAEVLRGFTLVGFYQPADGPLGVNIADLLAIGVDPAHQRQRIGTRLLEHAIELAAGQDVTELRLTVADSNQVGRRFFSSFGFQVIDESHGTYDGGQIAIRMARSL